MFRVNKALARKKFGRTGSVHNEQLFGGKEITSTQKLQQIFKLIY